MKLKKWIINRKKLIIKIVNDVCTNLIFKEDPK